MSNTTFSGVIAKSLAVGEKVKAAVLKAVSEVDGVASKLSADAPEIEAVAAAVSPDASKYASMGVSLVEQVASVLDAGGDAAAQNLTNAGLDSTLIADIKAEIANIKKL
jgi:hypothetical protein